MTLSTPNIEQVVMILSAGRTGTTAVAQYLNEGCRSVTALHEPKPSRSLRIASGRYLAGRNTKGEMIQLLEAARQKLCASVKTPIYVESNPYLYGFLDVLGEVFDRLRIVHITRDPRTSVRSAINFGAHSGLKRLFLAVVPYWTIRPEHLNSHPQRTWSQMSIVERLAWYWRVVNSHLDRGAELYGEDYRHFRYEDLLRSGGEGLQELADWIGAPQNTQALADLVQHPVNRSRRREVAEWEDWPEADRQLLLQHCAELMQTYGYQVEAASG